MSNLSKRKRRVITKRSGVLIATFLLCLLFNSIAFAAAGEGTVTMDNWIYGNTPANPVPASATNGTANVTYEYKTKGASDSTYTSQKPVNVGEYTVRATFASTANYDECKATHDFSITKRTLNVTANAQHREYKDANPNFTYAYSNNVASETPNFTGSLTTTATASSNVGTYDITLGTLALANDSASGFLANNYTLNYTKGTLTIDRKAIATPIANQNLVYTGSSITGVPAATDGSYTITGNTATNAGNYTAIATPTGNYMWNNGADVTSARNINWTINKKALNVIANNLQRAYGESNPTLTYTYNGQVNGQTPRFTGALATEATTESLSGLYDITQGTLALSDNGAFKANNYSINYTKGTLTIGRTPIPVPTAITGLVYDGTLKLGVLESDKYTVTGNKQSVAGNYTAIAVPGDNYEWNVGTNKTASVNIEWSIAKRDINQATVTLESNAIQYTGTEIIPSMVITYNSMILSENIDYTVTCENNVNVSSTTNKAKVIITGIGENYTGTKTVEFNITSKIAQIPTGLNYTYDGLEHSGTTIGEGYVLSNQVKQTDAGTYSVTATLEPGYSWSDNTTAPKSISWTIAKAPLIGTPPKNASKVFGTPNPNIYPIISGLQNGETNGNTGSLARQAGESASYYRITGIGTYQLADNGNFKKNNYTFTYNNEEAYFRILPLTLESATVTLNPNVVTYNGQNQNVRVAVSLNGQTLSENTDFTVRYVNNQNAGQATAYIDGIGNYSGTKITYFTINKLNLSNIENQLNVVITPTSFNYDGTYKTPNVSVSWNGINLVVDYDYTLNFTNNKEPGEAYVNIVGKGNFSGRVRKNFTIQRVGLEAEVTLSNTEYTYDGIEKRPNIVSVIASDGTSLRVGTDYTVEYANNINAGQAEVKIIGKGRYTGTITKNFVINKATPKITLRDMVVAYTGNNVTINEPTVEKVFNYKNKGENSVNAVIADLEYGYYTDSRTINQIEGAPRNPGEYWVFATLPEENYRENGVAYKNHELVTSNVARIVIFGAPNAPTIEANDGVRVIPNNGTVGSGVFVKLFGSEASFAPEALVRYKYNFDNSSIFFDYTEQIRITEEGTHTIYAKAYLVDNPNIESETVTYTVTVDRTAPAAGEVDVANITKSVVIDVAVAGEGISEVYITENSTKVPNALDNWDSLGEPSSENYGRVIFELSQGDGVKTIYVWQRDEGGNITGPVEKQIELRATKIGNYNNNKTNFSFKVSDKYLHTAQVTKDKIKLLVSGYDVNATITDLAEEEIENGKKYTATVENVESNGEFSFKVEATTVFDRAGNYIDPNSAIIDTNEITVDNIGPDLQVNVDGATAIVSVSDIHLKALTLNGAIVATTNGRYELQLRSGKNIIKAIDEYGNEVIEEVDNGVVTNYGKSVANKPELLDQMQAAYLNGGTWSESPFFTDEMYNYDNNEWANATTPDGSMWVWIPRYAYKEVYYTDSSMTEESSTPTQYSKLDVIYLRERSNEYIDQNGNVLPLPDGYIIPDAFTQDGGAGYELRGLWFGKYEISREDSSDGYTWNESTVSLGGGNVLTSSNIRMVSKPNKTPWRGISVGNAFTNSINMYPNDNSHLMKNSEYEATLILANSEYGNPNMQLDNTLPTGTATNTSSTGNGTGVFDLIGGSWEYTSTYINSSSLSTYGDSLISSTNNGIKEVITATDVNDFYLSEKEKELFESAHIENPYLTSYVIYRGADYTANDNAVESIPALGTPDERIGYRVVLSNDGTIVSDNSNGETNTGIDKIVLTLHPNGGDGAWVEVPLRIVNGNATYTLPGSGYYNRDGFILAGWAETPSATLSESHYEKGENITLTANKILYAMWKDAKAQYVSGSSFNQAIKRLAGNASATYYTSDTKIKSIEWQTGTFDISNVPNSAVNVAVSTGLPIYAWFEEDTTTNDGTGTIKLWSEANIVLLNNDSSYMFGMFEGIEGNINISNSLGLTQNTNNVTNMSDMFWNFGYTSMTSLNLGDKFDTSSVIDMSNMFAKCGYTSMSSLNLGNSFNTSSAEDMSAMFWNCGYTSMTSLDLGPMFDTSNVTSMVDMFSNCGYVKMTNLNLGSRFNTSNVTNMQAMFNCCGYTAMTSLDLGDNFDTSKVENMSDMFSSCGYTSMTNLNLGENFNTNSVTNMSSMFAKCGYTLMTSLDLGESFITSNVTDMSAMFWNCGYTAMTSINLGNNFDTSNVTSMEDMFSKCGYTSMTSLDLGDNFDTSKVTNMSNMFGGCGYISMTSLNLGSNFDTKNVTNMSSMFWTCGRNSMTTLDLGNKFDTSKVTNMQSMFQNCTNLKKIYAPTIFVTTNVTNSSEMFRGCTAINGGNGTTYVSSHVDKEYAWIDGRDDLPGYFWCHDEYTVTYDANAGTDTVTNMPSNTIKNYGEAIALELKTPIRANHVFKGWALAANGTPTFMPGDEYKLNNNQILYAIWEGKAYTIKFNSNGGTGTMADLAMNYGTPKNLTANVFTRTGYTFSKWNTKLDGTGKNYNNNQSVNINTQENEITLYAQWTANTYNIVFNKNGGSGTMSNQVMTYGNTASLTANTFTRTSYTFTGWNTKADGTGTSYTNGQSVTNLATSGNYNLYAQWKGISYTIRFDKNGGTGEMNPQAMTYGTAQNLTPNTFTRAGYDFVRWDTKADGTGISYSNGQSVNNLLATTGAITLYAQWDKSKYAVIFNSNGGTGTMANQEININVSTPLNANTFTRDGYDFKYWTLNADGTGTRYNDGANVTNLTTGSSVNLYAQWAQSDARYVSGSEVNMAFKRLAGSSSATIETEDNKIKGVQFVTTKPSQTIINSAENIGKSPFAPIYAWFEVTDSTSGKGIIKIFTEATTVEAVDHMSYMFYNMKALENINVTDNLGLTEPIESENMYSMFRNASNLQNITMGSMATTNNVTNMGSMFANCNSLQTLNLGSNFDTSNVTNMFEMFSNCSSLTSLDLGTKFNTQKVDEMFGMFNGCSSLTSLDLGALFDTSKITRTYQMFNECSSLTTLNLGSKFDTSKCEDMQRMFKNCQSLTSLNLGNKFDTSKATTMFEMFYGCSNLTSLDLGTKFDTSLVTTTQKMFMNCTNLETLNLRDNFNTSNVIKTSEMFRGCDNLTVLDLKSKFNTAKVTEMGFMFAECSHLVTIYAPDTFVTDLVTYDTDMFKGSTSLNGGSGTLYDASKVNKIYAWHDGKIDPSTGLNRPGYFHNIATYIIKYNANAGTDTVTGIPEQQSKTYGESLTLSSNVPVRASYVFKGWATTSSATVAEYSAGGTYTANSGAMLYAVWKEDLALYRAGVDINQVFKVLAGNSSATTESEDNKITAFELVSTKPSQAILNTAQDVGKNTNLPIYAWFEVTDTTTGKGKIKLYTEASSVGIIYDMSYLFYNMKALENINVTADLGLTKPTDTTNMYKMFGEDSSLTSITMGNMVDTSKVTNMGEIFDNCTSLTTLNLGSNFDTSKVTNMFEMFNNCSSLASIDLGAKFNTERVTDMFCMFNGCSSLTSLDLGDLFDTTNNTRTYQMFKGCSSLQSLDLGDKFNTINNTDMQRMFNGCSSLTSIDLGDKFDTSNTIKTSEMFRGCSSITELELGNKFNTSNVTEMAHMFADCTNLEKIFAPTTFVGTENVTWHSDMFKNSTNIKGGNGTVYDANHQTKEYAWIDGRDNRPGYFWCHDEYTVTFNANAGLDTVTGMPTGNKLTKVYGIDLAVPTLTRNGQTFKGWATTSSETVAEYDATHPYKANSGATLYAVWGGTSATYLPGLEFNQALKRLAGNASATYDIEDNTITAIEWQSGNFEINDVPATAVIVGVSSSAPIYAWFDNGTIKLWSEATTIKLNDNSAYLLYNFKALQTFSLSNLNVTDTTNVNDLAFAFDGDSSLTSINTTNLDVRNVRNLDSLFRNCSSLTTLDVSNFNTSSATNINSMFSGCSNITNLNVSGFDTQNVTSMAFTFMNCNKVQSLDVSNFVTDKVTNMNGLFYNCENLTALSLNNFDTSEVTIMNNMFAGCKKLTSLDLSSFDTSKVTSMAFMFNNCANMATIDVSTLDTSLVTNMDAMFMHCEKLTEIELSNFNTSQVAIMNNMFSNCYKLEKIYASTNFTTSNVTSSVDMFSGSTLIVGGNGTVYGNSHIDKAYAWIDGREDRPGYFWCHDEYTVTFNANAGSDTVTGMPTTKTKTYGIDLELPETPSRTGYIFKGWSVDSGATVASYDATHPYKANSGATLYAVWQEKNKVKILYNANGGAQSYEEYKYVGEPYTIFDTIPTKWDGAQFLGWSLVSGDEASTHIDYVAGDTYNGDTQLNLYAAWELLYVEVTLDPNGGNLGTITSPIRTRKGQNTVLPAEEPTRAGYSFLGWATSPTATTGTYAASEEVPIGADTILYAVWKEKTAQLTYNANGHGTAPSAVTMKYTTATNAASAISATGYTFGGWNTKADGSGTNYAAGAQVKAANTVPSAIILYAKWTPIQITGTIKLTGRYARGASTGAGQDVTMNETGASGSKNYTFTINSNNNISINKGSGVDILAYKNDAWGPGDWWTAGAQLTGVSISGLNANANWSCKLNIRGSLYWGDPETTPTDTGSVYRGTKTYTVSCTNKTVTITPTSVQTFNTETEIWNREGYAVGCGIESITITDFVRN